MSGASNISTVVDILDQPLIASSRYDQFYTKNSETGQFESNFDPSNRAYWTVFLDVDKNHTFSVTGDRKSSIHLVATVMHNGASVIIGDFVVANKDAGHFKIDKASLADTDGSVTITDFSPVSLNGNSTAWTLAFDGARQSAPASQQQLNAQPQLQATSSRQGANDLIAPSGQVYAGLAMDRPAMDLYAASNSLMPNNQSSNSS